MLLRILFLHFILLGSSSASSDPCQPDEYACPNEDKCIPRHLFCDGMADCSDGSDEKAADLDSTGIVCRRNRFTCLLPEEYESRKDIFCKGRVECRPEDFACADGSRCVQWNDFCDGYRDCWDNSDEQSVEPGLPGIPCRMGREYHNVYTPARECMLPEKYAHRKEETCVDISTCKSDEFRCLDGSGCLDLQFYCNGVPNCKDESDELSIHSEIEGFVCRSTRAYSDHLCKFPQIYAEQREAFCRKESRCSEDEFACLDGSGCVSWTDICYFDIPRCKDKSDVIKANSKTDGFLCRVNHYQNNVCRLPRIYFAKRKKICAEAPRCRRDEFRCSDGSRCLPISRFCDRSIWCLDGSDEKKPTKSTTTICRRGKNFCALPRRLLRRKDEYCDEIVKCLPEEFACSDGEKCIPKDQFCDGTPQCNDGSDEILSTGDNGTPCLGDHGKVCVLPGNEAVKKEVLCRVQCRDDQFECRDHKQCVDGGWWCDGEAYCLDYSNDVRPHLPAHMTGIPCRYDDWICVLPEDQAHKKEHLCKKNAECNDDEFACLDGSRCISKDQFCDGFRHCFYDGSDELSPASNVTGVLCKGQNFKYFEQHIFRPNVCIIPEGQAWKKKFLCKK